jgi:hypothetical protein
VTAVVENAREFRGKRTTGTALALRLPEHVGVDRVSVVFDGSSGEPWVWGAEEVPVLIVPGSSFCAAFPGKADLCPAGEAQSLLMRATHGYVVMKAASRRR